MTSISTEAAPRPAGPPATEAKTAGPAKAAGPAMAAVPAVAAAPAMAAAPGVAAATGATALGAAAAPPAVGTRPPSPPRLSAAGAMTAAGAAARVRDGLAAPLLAHKTQVPAPGFLVLPRPRVDALMDAATRHRVTFVTGPAGAGKTVACAAWASSPQVAGRVAWLTVGPYDRGEVFWAYLRAALLRADPCEALRALDPVPARGFPLRLVAAVQDFARPLVLVLDDVHELADGSVLNGLDVVIRHAPPALRLVLVARRAPALQLGRLRVAGELADIGTSDLACTAEEADAYFAMLGADVPAADRDDLLGRTEGWMTGLRLAAMSTRLDTGEGGVAGLSGSEPLVTDYLWGEVLARHGSHTRAFLARTAVVGELCGDLADSLTSEAGGEAVLARLSRENSFVTASGGQQRTYRYHPLLREVLLDELHRTFPHEVPVLFRRAARWYAQHDQPLDAVECAVASGDWAYAAQAVAECAVAAVVTAGPAALESVLGRFPDGWGARDAAVSGAWAVTRLWSRDLPGAARFLRAAEAALDRATPAVKATLEPTLAALRVLHMAESGASASQRPPGQRSAEEALRAPATTRAEHRAAGLLWFAVGVSEWGRGDVARAATALRHADRELGAGRFAALRSRARGWLGIAEAWAGSLRAAEQVCGPRSPAEAPAPVPARLRALALAQVSLARADLAAARRLLTDAGAAGADVAVPGEPALGVAADLLRGQVSQAGGDRAGMEAALVRLRVSRSKLPPVLSVAVTVTEVRAAVCAGDTSRARALAQRLTAGTTAAVVRAQVLLAGGDFRGALDVVAPCLDGRLTCTPAEQTAAWLVASVAHRRTGEATQASAAMDRALALAAPEAACQVFLDGGAAVRSAVMMLVPPASRDAGFAGQVLERFVGHGIGQPGERVTVPSVGLTDSERAVLSFLPSHMTNVEISQALFLSVNTVKTHLRTAYRKLGVGSRREAIAQGRRLGLLLPPAQDGASPTSSRSPGTPSPGQAVRLAATCGACGGAAARAMP